MARGNDLKLSPDQRPLESHASSPPNAEYHAGKSAQNDGIEVSSESDGNSDIPAVRLGEVQVAGTKVINGEPRDPEDEEEAEGIAGLINDASLSSINHASPKIASKATGGILSLISGMFGGGSQKTFKSSEGSNSNVRPKPLSSAAQIQNPAQEIHNATADMSAPEGVDRVGTGLLRPSTVYEDISKRRKSRSSGLPDPYDFQESPPKVPVAEPKPKELLKRNEQKSKKTVIRGKARQTVLNGEEEPNSERVEMAAQQPHLEPVLQSTRRVTRAQVSSREQPAATNLESRTARAKAYDENDHAELPTEVQQSTPGKSQKSGKATSPMLATGTKRKRGRPRKEVKYGKQTGSRPPETMASDGVSAEDPGDILLQEHHGDDSQEEDLEGREELRNGAANTSNQVALAEAVRRDSDGVSSILLNPSPIKLAQQPSTSLRRPSQTTKERQGQMQGVAAQKAPKIRPEPIPALEITPKDAQKGPRSTEDSEDEEDGEKLFYESNARRINSSQPATEQPDRTVEIGLIEEETLKSMLATVQKVGKDQYGTLIARNEKYLTKEGKQLRRGAERLSMVYKKIDELKSADVVSHADVDAQREKASALTSALIRKLSAISNTVRMERLGDDDSITNMLHDLYFFVIPALVEVLNEAAKPHFNQRPPGTPDLEELTSLVQIVYDVVEASRNQKKGIQPKPQKNKSYSLSRPTVLIKPQLERLLKRWQMELTDRSDRKRAEEARKTAPERARKRKERLAEEERAREEEFQQKLRERNRAIWLTLNERRAQLGLVPCSQPSRTPSGSQQYPSSQQQQRQINLVIEEYYDHGEEETDEDKRVKGLFGKDNSHPGTTAKEWAPKEMKILVDGLRSDTGERQQQAYRISPLN
jgi:hypothetical protein